MSDIRLYGIPGSPFLRSVEIGVREKGLNYELEVMSPADMRTAQHLEKHPFGRIPIFEHLGFQLYETQAILRYLDDTFPDPPLMPGNPKARARVNQVVGIIECYFFPKASAPIAFNRIIGPKLLGLPSNEAAIAEAMPMARTCFATLDGFLGAQPFLSGDSISIADIMLGAQLDLLCGTPEGLELIRGTRLQSWLDRMRVRPSFAATQPPAVLKEAA